MINNKLLQQDNLNARKEKASKTYGISKELSSLFAFPLDNTIFIYSSKEKDQYRILKYNNIIIFYFLFRDRGFTW